MSCSMILCLGAELAIPARRLVRLGLLEFLLQRVLPEQGL